MVVQGDRHVLVVHPDQLRDFLGLEVPGYGASYQDLVEAMNRALEAVERAVKQVPTERLSDPTPNRGRDLRELAFNITDRVPRMVQCLDSGWYERDRENEFERSRWLSTPEQIGKFIAEARMAWYQRAKQVDTEMAAQIVSTDRGDLTHLQLLESQAYHTGQHLRQIYIFLRQIGIEPVGEMTAKELLPIRLAEAYY